jgi:hypothetical protein
MLATLAPTVSWLLQPSLDRPTYECPSCHEQAMQFFRVLPKTSQVKEMQDSFVCCACGETWKQRPSPANERRSGRERI